MPKSYILLADNERDFLDTRAEYLESPDYVVLKAYSLEEARRLMAEARIHVAILDIRMLDDDDERDTSGLTLAKEPAFQSIPKIMLTGFPSYEYVREVLGPVLNGLPAAVQFLAKAEGPEAMLEAVATVLSQYSRINWDLTMHWATPHSFTHLVNLIQPNLSYAQLPDRAGELEDLFRRLFFDYKQITLGRLLVQANQKIWLAVFAFSPEGTPRHLVICCGPKEKIEAEQSRYERFAAKAGGEAGTVKTKMADTVHFAAVTYLLSGIDLEETATLVEFYRNSPTEVVTPMLDRLFETTLQPWYSRGRFRPEAEISFPEFFLEWLDLPADLSLKLHHLCQQALTAGLVEISCTPYQLLLPQLGETPAAYPNPLAHFTELINLDIPTLWGTTYGQPDGQTILVDRRGQPRLINFSQADQGPLVRDFVALESVIKFDLLATPDLHLRHGLEKGLLAVSRLDEPLELELGDVEIEKAFRAINHLRRQAVQVIGYDPKAYWAGLLFYTLARLRQYEAEIQYTRHQLSRYLHSLLSAAMLCEKLLPRTEKNLPAQALRSLWVNEPEKEVWVEGQRIDLAPTEYELLLVLYQRPNRLCSRQEISQQLYGLDYGLETEDAINTTMTRLRRKIEADSSGKYILTARGRGYKLRLNSASTA